MADPISLTSGLIAITVFTLQASRTLFATVSSFKGTKRVLRELNEELVALEGVLVSLQDTINGSNADLTALELPLLRCGKACEEFDMIIRKCMSNSGGARAIRDWAKVQYMGEDITGFRVLLAGYKSTITIAICDANMKTMSITTSLLSQYKLMIETTASDLEEQLDNIDKKLERLAAHVQPYPTSTTALDRQITDQDQETLEADKRGIEQCIEICAQVSDHIDRVQTQTAESSSTDPASSQTTYLAQQLTTGVLTGCKSELVNTTSLLQRQLDTIKFQLAALSEHPETLGSAGESLKQCLAICAQASEQAKSERINVFEDITAHDDGDQIVVSTLGDLISAKRITVGSRSLQLLGQMSDESLQHFASKARTRSPQQSQPRPEEHEPVKFAGRHGAGHKLGV
ncbi:hypothetical protein Dda_4892 [Drechslerella dactyloides]|uniref:Azaphilone pigments biosynthesis cluster protein L N-terminal domain-containing protein n=1 Tax=Drechslerella dactyloides TaxID=74499 RepID=A0AAD6NJS8_DREDA|nr:hypothetical protein Dda_4892 [Drechslerella dactyloides]